MNSQVLPYCLLPGVAEQKTTIVMDSIRPHLFLLIVFIKLLLLKQRLVLFFIHIVIQAKLGQIHRLLILNAWFTGCVQVLNGVLIITILFI